jgi:flagellar FliL protein
VITEKATKEEIKKTSELEEKQKLAADGAVRIINLPEMNINLRSRVGGRNHYATISIAMKCNNDACMEEMKALRVKVEDTIQTMISSRSYAELTMSEASFRLKHEITRSVNSLLKNGTVTDTFFSDYTVQ